jgi:hypothetical protein
MTDQPRQSMNIDMDYDLYLVLRDMEPRTMSDYIREAVRQRMEREGLIEPREE